MNDFPQQPLRSSWNSTRMLIRGPLTDRKIEQYRKKGWYDQSFKDARRELMIKKNRGKFKREGGFLKDGDRMIYNPL